MRFSIRELSALVKMAIALANVDEQFADGEKEVIIKELIHFNCDQSEAEFIFNRACELTSEEAFRILVSLDAEQKRYATGFLAAVIVADGEIKDDEVKLWQFVCTVADCPSMTMREAYDFWRAN